MNILSITVSEPIIFGHFVNPKIEVVGEMGWDRELRC
jgi:hypothetical protein